MRDLLRAFQKTVRKQTRLIKKSQKAFIFPVYIYSPYIFLTSISTSKHRTFTPNGIPLACMSTLANNLVAVKCCGNKQMVSKTSRNDIEA